MRLPRELERDPRLADVEAALSADRRALWSKGTLPVAHVDPDPRLFAAIRQAWHAGRSERGLERAEKLLDRERVGLEIARIKQGTGPANRVSRLLLLTNDGSERFYRGCESLLLRHSDRVLGIHLNASSEQFSEVLGEPGALVRLVLVADREPVSRILLTLAPFSANDDGGRGDGEVR